MDAAGGTVYRGVTDKETVMTEPGLIVYRFDAPLVFANAAFFTERLEALVANAGAGLKCVILDAEPISDFDSTAAEALETLDADLERLGADLWIARANGPLRAALDRDGTDETAWRRAHLSVGARSRGGVSGTILKTFWVCETQKVWLRRLCRRAGARGGGENAERTGGSECLPAAMYAELLVDVGPVALHGLVRHDQLLRDFLGGHVLRQQLQDLQLAPGQGLDHGHLCGGLLGGRYGRLRL